MAKRRDLLGEAQVEVERRSRVMAEAVRFSPYGRQEREEPPAEGEEDQATLR